MPGERKSSESFSKSVESKEISKEKMSRSFESICKQLKKPIEYKDSKGEIVYIGPAKMLRPDKEKGISICRPRDPNKSPFSEGNLRSIYTLAIKGGNYSLHTTIFDEGNVISEVINQDLSLDMAKQSLSNFEGRIAEHNSLVFGRAQEYADNQQENDKKEAANILQNLMSDSSIA